MAELRAQVREVESAVAAEDTYEDEFEDEFEDDFEAESPPPDPAEPKMEVETEKTHSPMPAAPGPSILDELYELEDHEKDALEEDEHFEPAELETPMQTPRKEVPGAAQPLSPAPRVPRTLGQDFRRRTGTLVRGVASWTTLSSVPMRDGKPSSQKMTRTQTGRSRIRVLHNQSATGGRMKTSTTVLKPVARWTTMMFSRTWKMTTSSDEGNRGRVVILTSPNWNFAAPRATDEEVDARLANESSISTVG